MCLIGGVHYLCDTWGPVETEEWDLWPPPPLDSGKPGKLSGKPEAPKKPEDPEKPGEPEKTQKKTFFRVKLTERKFFFRRPPGRNFFSRDPPNEIRPLP